MSNQLDALYRRCRVCGGTGLPPYARVHVACKPSEPEKRKRGPKASGRLCRICKGGVRRPGDLCSHCADVERAENRDPLKDCRKCGEHTVTRKQGASTCDKCRVRGRPRTKKLTQAMQADPECVRRLVATGDHMTREEVAVALGISHETVRLIEYAAMEKFERGWLELVGPHECH